MYKDPSSCPCTRAELADALVARQVTALVFYGRRRNVKLLNRYLESNLASAGGILHEVGSHVLWARPRSVRVCLWLLACLLAHVCMYECVFWGLHAYVCHT